LKRDPDLQWTAKVLRAAADKYGFSNLNISGHRQDIVVNSVGFLLFSRFRDKKSIGVSLKLRLQYSLKLKAFFGSKFFDRKRSAAGDMKF
jgi:hypothetical protein